MSFVHSPLDYNNIRLSFLPPATISLLGEAKQNTEELSECVFVCVNTLCATSSSVMA